MSLEAWKKKFYPVSAREVTKKDALDHSFKKWEGLTNENLKKFNLKRDYDCIVTNDKTMMPLFSLNADSCALCFHFFDYSTNCKKCPIVKSGEKSCNENNSAYDKVVYGGKSASIMLKTLEKAKKFC